MTTETDNYRELPSRLRSAHLLGTVVSRTECEIEAADAIAALINERDENPDAEQWAELAGNLQNELDATKKYDAVLRSAISEIEAERDHLARENERLREALTFYANRSQEDYRSAVLYEVDIGQRARAALANAPTPNDEGLK